MAAKMCAKRRAAFFGALRATGNQTLAAERAKVSRSWVSKHRTEDPAFRTEMEAAIAAAEGRLKGASGVGPNGAWRAQEGEELTVRGTNGCWKQVARARLKQWTPRVEARFLGALATSCNVKRACAEVGLSPASAYNHRERWPMFGRRWDQALEEGYDRLSTALVAHAGAMLGDADFVPEQDLGPMTVDEILHTLRLNRARVTGEGPPAGLRRRAAPEPTLEDVRGSIIAKFEVLERSIQAKMTPEDRERRRAVLWGEIPLTDEVMHGRDQSPDQSGSLSAPIATSSIE